MFMESHFPWKTKCEATLSMENNRGTISTSVRVLQLESVMANQTRDSLTSERSRKSNGEVAHPRQQFTFLTYNLVEHRVVLSRLEAEFV